LRSDVHRANANRQEDYLASSAIKAIAIILFIFIVIVRV